MLRLPLSDLAKRDVEALLTEQTPEGRSLEYKRDLALESDSSKREFAKDVSSFANGSGGFLVIGVEEKQGAPVNILGVECPDWDKLQQRIENVLRDRLDPRVQRVGIHKVDGFERGPVVILHIPKSWIGPHMVSFTGQTHFYSRNSSGVHPLDVREIGNAFRHGTEQSENLRRFRDSRIGIVLSGETPVPLWSSDPKLIVHACPLEPYTAEEAKDFGNPGRMPPLAHGSGWNNRHNVDGFVTYSGPNDQPKRSYSLAFRTGAFEGVAIIERHKDKDWVWGQRIEKQLRNGVGLFSDLTRERGYDGPLLLMAAMTNVFGVRIVWDEFSEDRWAADHTIDRATLILPDILLPDPQADVEAALTPLVDALWQSSGWPSRPG